MTRTLLRAAATPLAPLALLALLAGCAGGESEEPDVYTTRGIVRQVTVDERTQEAFIHHEAIPDFENDRGEVEGMASMAMPFPAEPEVLEGLEAGDRVRFTFEVRWNDGPPLRLTEIEPLPEGTRLDFEKAEPTPDPEPDTADDTAPTDETPKSP